MPRRLLSAPGIGAVPKKYSKTFEHSCDRHDFGYRNDASNTSTPASTPQFDPDDYRRDTIDKRFLLNMTVQQGLPARVPGGGPGARYAAAKTFYGVVNSKLGESAFQG